VLSCAPVFVLLLGEREHGGHRMEVAPSELGDGGSSEELGRLAALRRQVFQLATLQRGFTFRQQRIVPKDDWKGDSDGFEVHESKVSTAVRYSYGAPQFAVLALYMLLAVHATLLYEYLGAPLAFIAFFTAFARSMDVFTDPIMSWISDSTRSSYGRRIPYMFVGSFFYAAAVVLLLGVGVIRQSETLRSCQLNGTNAITNEDEYVLIGNSSNEDLSVAYWYGAFFVVFYLFDTLANVPYNALAPELSESSVERENVYFTQNIFGMVGTMVGAVGPPLLETAGLEKGMAFLITGIFFGSYYVLAATNLARNIGERGEGFINSVPVPLVPSTVRSFGNPGFRVLVLAWFVDAIGWFALASVLPFYVVYFLQPRKAGIEFLTDEIFLGIALCTLFVSAILGMPFWRFLARKIGRYRAWLAYNLWNGASNALYILVGPQDWELAIAITVLNGIPFGGKFLSDATLADCIDYAELQSGERREAQFTVFASFIPKIVSIPSQALPLAIVAALGFIPSSNTCDEVGDVVIQPSEQPDTVRLAIKIIFAFFPVATNLISFVIKTKYPITSAKIMSKISAGIALHSRGLPAEDPLTGNILPSPKKFFREEQIRGIEFDYFYSSEKRKLYLNDSNFGPLIQTLSVQLVTIGILVIATAIGVARTFRFLEIPALSWAPCFLQICLGICAMAFVFTLLRLRQAISLRSRPFAKNFMRKWIELTEGAHFDDGSMDPKTILARLREEVHDEDEGNALSAASKRALFRKGETFSKQSNYFGSTRNMVQVDEEEKERLIERILQNKD